MVKFQRENYIKKNDLFDVDDLSVVEGKIGDKLKSVFVSVVNQSCGQVKSKKGERLADLFEPDEINHL